RSSRKPLKRKCNEWVISKRTLTAPVTPALFFAMSGYSGTPLVRKLGMKPGMRIYLYLPPPDYDAMIETYPADVTFASRLTGTLDFIHLFCMSMREYQMNFDRCMT